MVSYGDDDTVATMLEPSTPAGFSESLTARIAAMREVVSRRIDARTGRTWGVVGTSETRVIRRSTGMMGGLLILPTPARTITAITTGVTDEAGVITGGTAIEASQWTIGLTDNEGNITAIRKGWYGTIWGGFAPFDFGYYDTITVTGTWADTGADTDIPADINFACNYITAKLIAEQQASPAGFVGSDGSVVPIRIPWNDPTIKDIIRDYELVTHGLVL